MITYVINKKMKFKTTIESEDKKLFTVFSEGEENISWECYGSTTGKEHTQALLELLRIGYEIGKMKTIFDSKRIEDSDDPITFG